MKVSIQIHGKSQDVLNILKREDGLGNVHKVHNGIIADVVMNNNLGEIPQVLWAFDPRVLLEPVEKGGLHVNGSVDAQVVCGTSGRAIMPYHVETGQLRVPCGLHAHFAVPHSVVTVKAESDGRVLIERHVVSVEDDEVRLSKEQVYHGHPQNLRGNKGKYKEAAEAAAIKGKTGGCKVPLYVKERRQA